MGAPSVGGASVEGVGPPVTSSDAVGEGSGVDGSDVWTPVALGSGVAAGSVGDGVTSPVREADAEAGRAVDATAMRRHAAAAAARAGARTPRSTPTRASAGRRARVDEVARG